MDDAPFTTVADSRPHRPEGVPRADLPRLFGTCAWFRALAAEHQAMVLGSAYAERLEGGAWIARRQEPSDYWIGVHSGLIKLAIYNASGRSCTLSGVPAIQPSLAMFVPSGTFHTLLESSLPFTGFVIRQLNNRMGEFITSIQNSRLLDVDARVAQSLAQLFNPDLYPDTGRTLAISQEEVGLLAGVSRQRINQALQNLERLQILRLSYNQIDVLDLERLCAFGQEQI